MLHSRGEISLRLFSPFASPGILWSEPDERPANRIMEVIGMCNNTSSGICAFGNSWWWIIILIIVIVIWGGGSNHNNCCCNNDCGCGC